MLLDQFGGHGPAVGDVDLEAVPEHRAIGLRPRQRGEPPPAHLAVGAVHGDLDIEGGEAGPRLGLRGVEGGAMLREDPVEDQGGVGHGVRAGDPVDAQAAGTCEEEAPRAVGPALQDERHAQRIRVGRWPHDRVSRAQLFHRSTHQLLRPAQPGRNLSRPAAWGNTRRTMVERRVTVCGRSPQGPWLEAPA